MSKYFVYVLKDSDVYWIEKEADARHNLHLNQESSRPLNSNYEYTGLAGERTFEVWSGIPMDVSRRIAGDNGTDFLDSIDVKTAKKPYNLLVEVGKVNAEIYVLAGINPDDMRTVTLYGWCYREELFKNSPKTFGYNILNHHVHRSKLKPMDRLKQMIRGEMSYDTNNINF